MKILVALDDSPYSGRVLESLTRRKFAASTQLKLLTVIEPLPEEVDHKITQTHQINEGRKNAARKLLEKSREALANKLPDRNVHFEIREGDPREQIIDCASEWNASLILIGAHGHGLCPTHHLSDHVGSVSRDVASNANCSVEVVRVR